MDTTAVIVIPDSALVHDTITNFLPGIHVGFVALLAGFMASRGLFVLRLLVKYGPTIIRIPGVKQLLNVIKLTWEGKEVTNPDGSVTKTKGLGWLINIVLMVLAGYWATGSIGWGSLIGFAGIGVREFLVSSPIPTSRKELRKLKSKMAIILFVPFLFLFPGRSEAQTQFTLDRITVAVGGGYKQQYLHKAQDNDYPFGGARAGYILSGHLKVELEYERRLARAADQSLRAGVWMTF
jgi:hypothetical protein